MYNVTKSSMNIWSTTERLKFEQEQRIMKNQEKLSSRMKTGKGIDISKPARKQHWTISDLLDTDLNEMTEQVEMYSESSKSRSNSKQLDFGAEEQESHSNEGKVEESKDEELQKVADRFGRDVLEGLMKGLSSDMSRWAKEKDPSLRGAWESAIKKTQETVAKLAEMKDGEEKSRQDEPSKFKHSKGDKMSASSEQDLHPEEHRTKDGDGFNQEANYQEQEKKSSHIAPADISKSSKGEVRDRIWLKEQVKRVRDLNQEALERRLAVEKELDAEDDLKVEEEEEEGWGGEGVGDLDEEQKSSDSAAADGEEEEEEEEEEGELDEESLTQLEEEIVEKLQKQLDDAGLGNNGNIIA